MLTASLPNFDPFRHASISDLSQYSHNIMAFYLKKSKTNQSGYPTLIFYFQNLSPLVASVLSQTLNYRRSNSLSLSYPLFLSESVQVVSRSWFHYHLRQIVIQSGISPSIFVQTLAISELHRLSFINWRFWGLTDARAPLQTSEPPHTTLKNTSHPCHSFSPTNK